jgi:hypothetical protein
MIYLASPYSHPDPAVMESRYREVVLVVGRMTERGHHVYSPIVHYHEVAKLTGLSTSAEFWTKINHATIDLCESVYVLRTGGWMSSVGVLDEISYAKEKGIQVWYLKAWGSPI